MKDAGIGRLLVASLHQGIADRLPDRLEFYENWLHPQGLRDGTIGLAPLHAVLSFLRTEGPAYDVVTATAGAYAAEWLMDEMTPLQKRWLAALPLRFRRRSALGLMRDLVSRTYSGSSTRVRVRRGVSILEIRGSIFCGVRDPVTYPLCRFYAAAAERLLARAGMAVDTSVVACQATGHGVCHVQVLMRDPWAIAPEAARVEGEPVA